MKNNKLLTVLSGFLLTLTLAACATGPSALRYLDERTGATVSKVRTPLVFYRAHQAVTEPVGPVTGEVGEDFLTIAPFEINRQGRYSLFMRVEWPGHLNEDRALPSMKLMIDGEAIVLEPHTTDVTALGLASPVYPEDLFSARVGYYRMSWPDLDRIAAATEFGVEADNSEVLFIPWGKQTSIIDSFREFEQLPRPDRYRTALRNQ